MAKKGNTKKNATGQRKKTRRKHITVKERKLGRERAVGLAYSDYYGPDKGLIEIDPRQKGKDNLDTLIHEALHLIYPDLSEATVVKHAGRLTRMLWRAGYRRVDQ